MIGKNSASEKSNFARLYSSSRGGERGTSKPRRPTPNGRQERTRKGGSSPARSILDLYLAEIRRYPWLTREQEAILAREAQAGRSDAFDWLIACNLPFVVKIAGEYRNRGLPFEDLIGEGNLGLIEAARRFDPSHGARFVTWAVWWIRKSICHAIAERAHVVRLPASQVKKVKVVRATKKALEGQLGREPTGEEMSASLPSRLAGLDPIHRHGIRCDSLDEPTHGGRRENLSESLEDKRQTSVEEQMVSRETADGISALYAQLDDQQRAVLACRLGLDGEEPLTLEEIGQRIGRSREGVRLIEAKAMRQLRKLFAAVYKGQGKKSWNGSNCIAGA